MLPENALPERGSLIALEEHKRVGFLRIKAKKTEREKLTYEPKCFCKHEAGVQLFVEDMHKFNLRLGVWVSRSPLSTKQRVSLSQRSGGSVKVLTSTCSQTRSVPHLQQKFNPLFVLKPAIFILSCSRSCQTKEALFSKLKYTKSSCDLNGISLLMLEVQVV